MSGRNPEDPDSTPEPALSPTPEAAKQDGAANPMVSGLFFDAWSTWFDAMAKSTGAQTGANETSAQESWASSQAMLNEGLQQFKDFAAKDPVLRAAEDSMNANPLHQVIPVDWAEIARALRIVALRSLSRPDKAMTAAAAFGLRQWQASVETWSETWLRWSGVAKPETEAPKGADKRFAAPEWQGHPMYRTLKEFYLLASDWLMNQSEDAQDMTPQERQHLDFHLRQFVNAMSPALMLVSNPVAMRRAVETGGASVMDGMRNLMLDLKEGRLSLVDDTAFEVGRNLATTPGKVVYRNKLIELIQYAPQSETVHQVPLLILPSWINKFYILDMQPKNSMVLHLAKQGYTVFIVSWRNPDATLEDTTIDDYMNLGPLAASDAIRDITGSPTVNVMGYCIGGTLLAITLAWLAARDDKRFGAATFMVSLQDFSEVGETAVFLNDPTAVDLIEQNMLERGYLDSREVSNMFSLLRSNDLIWSQVVNNYLLGQKPPAFDLLYWNNDGTRMARTAHGWYLRNTYIENNLIKPGHIQLQGETLDLGRITLDIYAVGAEKDHIVPWNAAARITQLTGSHPRFILASSGHIAGIINPPGGKGIFWTNDHGDPTAPKEWMATSQRHAGSWWTDWFAWLAPRSGDQVAPPSMGSATYPPLEDAPGQFVLVK